MSKKVVRKTNKGDEHCLDQMSCVFKKERWYWILVADSMAMVRTDSKGTQVCSANVDNMAAHIRVAQSIINLK